MTTDPVAQTVNPIWDTELAWDIQHKQLSYMRSARAPLKLVVYSLDTITGQREVVGWIVLDLRAAQGGETPTPKWYPLLAHGKSAFRPEVKIAFSVSPAKTKLDYLSPTSSPTRPKMYLQSQTEMAEISSVTKSVNLTMNQQSSTTDSKIVAQKDSEPNPQVTESQDPHPKKPITNLSVSFSLTSEGHYQVGKESENILDITIWVTIAFAQHLDNLLSDDKSTQLPPSSVFCFYYSFLGNDITTQHFSNLIDPNFPAERVSIRLKGSRKDLATLFKEIGKLVFYFCKESAVYGYADVELADLALKLDDSTKDLKFPLVNEGVYPLCFGGAKSKNPAGTISNSSIGVSLAISLTKEHLDINVLSAAGIAIERKLEKSEIDITMESKTQQEYLVNGMEFKTVSEEKNGIGNEAIENLPLPDTPSRPTLPLLQKDEIRVSFRDLNPSAPIDFSSHEFFQKQREGIPDFDPRFGVSPVEWHQFRFSIEMRSIRAFKLKSANVFLKYSYAPFGTSSPYLSHPVTQLTLNEGEILLPHSFCSFEFAMAPKRLETYLESVPLIIEVFHKDPNRKNILIGSCSVDLGQVLQNHVFQSSRITRDQIHSADFFSPISSLGPAADKYTTIGELRTLLALEDFGSLQDVGNIATQKSSKEEKVPDIHDTLEYQTVLELELWRQNQQDIFEEKMKQKEKDLEDTYALKIRDAEKESELVLNAKLVEYSTKIAKLQTLSDQLQEREISIQRAERDLVLEKANLEREAAAALQSQRDAARRLEESFAHSFEILKQKVQDSEKKNEVNMRERDAFRQRVMELEVKGQAAKTGANSMEEMLKLSSEIVSLKAQNERLVTSRHDMKKKYKTLFRLYTTFKTTSENQLQEIQALKKSKAQESERAGVIKRELESLEKENLEIKSISKAVNELKKAVTPSLPPTPKPLDPSTKLNIDRLQKEKVALLDGAYTSEDELIVAFDTKIQELQNK